jgi:glucan phosphorylase
MTANRVLIGHKINHVISEYAELAKVSLREAFDIFYKSRVYHEITNGISDMHCRSDGYLAEELEKELRERQS